jgi:hypothetical protein
MFEKTKLIMLLVFTIDFLAFCVLVGNLYEKMGITRTISIIICAVLTVILAAVFVMDMFFSKRGKVD